MTSASHSKDNLAAPTSPGVRDQAVPSRASSILLAAVIGALVAAYSLWYTSSGHFPFFPDIQNDYVDLGQSFLRGELSLLEQPDPRLADLGDPYEYTQRKDIPYHWDASYYAGRYYLYWGPVPALVSAAYQALTGSPPSASMLVDLPYIGLLGIAAILLFHVSERYGAGARWTVWLFLVIGFFNLPMLFTIGQPRHYQASIMYGQFFLLAGVASLLLYTRRRSLPWLIVSGLAWGLAFGSRYNLAISIAIFVGFAALWLWRDRARASVRITMALLLAPLLLCLLGLGLYNQARFHDPFETGMTYQLTIPEFRQVSYSTAYIPSGLYAYLLYPLSGSQSFPFIQSAHFRPSLLPDSLYIPPGREFDQIAFGLFPTVPAVWLSLAAIPLIVLIVLGRGGASAAGPSRGASPAYVFSMLASGAAGQFVFLMVFFYVAERYIVDFFVPLIVCLAIVIWQLQAALRGMRALQGGLWVLVAVATGWTALIGYFACFGVPVLVSLYYDPAMLMKLAAFWNARYAALLFLIRGGG